MASGELRGGSVSDDRLSPLLSLRMLVPDKAELLSNIITLNSKPKMRYKRSTMPSQKSGTSLNKRWPGTRADQMLDR